MDGDDQLTSTRGNFTSVRGAEFIFFRESVWGEDDTKFKKQSNFFFSFFPFIVKGIEVAMYLFIISKVTSSEND